MYCCLQDFPLGTHPTFWNATYNIVRWIRSSNTWVPVPWFNNQRKDAACGGCPKLAAHRHGCVFLGRVLQLVGSMCLCCCSLPRGRKRYTVAPIC
jgi:hypothetical protein